MYGVLGQGEITTEMLESNLADLKEADTEFWFLVPVYSDISPAQVALIDWLNANDVWWRAVVEEGEDYDEAHVASAAELETTDAIIDYMRDEMLKGEYDGTLLTLLEDLENPSEYDQAVLDIVADVLRLPGNQVLELNHSLTPLDAVADDQEEPVTEGTPSGGSGFTRNELEGKRVNELRALARAEGWVATGVERDEIIAVLLGEQDRPEAAPAPTEPPTKKGPPAKKPAPSKVASTKKAPAKAAAAKTETDEALPESDRSLIAKLLVEALEAAIGHLRATV